MVPRLSKIKMYNPKQANGAAAQTHLIAPTTTHLIFLPLPFAILLFDINTYIKDGSRLIV